MKQESKIIVEWIKKNISQSAADEHYDEWKKAVDFLDSLPAIESRLTKGGYIADKYNKPACAGNKISFKLHGEKGDHTGTLMWSDYDAAFFVQTRSTGTPNKLIRILMNDVEEFAKVSE